MSDLETQERMRITFTVQPPLASALAIAAARELISVPAAVHRAVVRDMRQSGLLPDPAQEPSR